jgi:hypothetical protein
MKFPIFCAKKNSVSEKALFVEFPKKKVHFRFIGTVSDENRRAGSNSGKQFSPLAYMGLVQK